MRKIMNGAAAAACVLLLAAAAGAQTIDDIQVYDAEGDPVSPYNGQVVTVTGDIYVVKGTYNSGTHYIQSANGGIQFFSSTAPALTYGDRVQITGTVSTYFGEIQINAPTITPQPGGSVPVATAVALTDLLSPPDYEWVGNFISVIGTVGRKGTSNFYLYSGSGTDSIQVYIDSDTGITLGAVDNGDLYQVFSPCVVYNGEIELKPRRQSDLVENPLGDPVPVIDDVVCTNWMPTSAQAITVTATVTDAAKSLTSVQLYWRNDDGDSTGAFTPVTMTVLTGNTYQGVIPAPHPQRQVDFYVRATDNAAQSSTNPGNAPASWYEVAIGITSIYQVQWAHPDSVYQGSPFRDKVVNVEGVVTAGTGEAGAVSKFVMQEPLPATTGIIAMADGYKWGGLLVYGGTGGFYVQRGDKVRVGGYIDEYFGLTEMNPHDASAVFTVSYGNDLPPASYATTRILGDRFDISEDGNGNLGEAYESVWVRTRAAKVVDDMPTFDSFLISDTGLRADSLEVNPYAVLTYAPVIGDVVIVEGFMDYFYDRLLVPLANEFIVTGLTGVEEPLPSVKPAGGFVSLSPNPFNPKVDIRFMVSHESLTQVNVYDLRGQLVKTLVNGILPAQEHLATWDGRDMHGAKVASGTYFARLRIGSELMQVQKLSLIK